MPSVRWAVYLALILPITSILVSTMSALAQDDQDRLEIVTKEIVPFVTVSGDDVDGFSIDLWEAVAAELELNYDFVIVETIDAQLDAVASGMADAGIAAISITREREETMDFSFPYFESGLGILTAKQAHVPLLSLLAAAFSPTMLKLLAGLALLILVAGNLVWFLERRRPGDFSKGYVRGVWEGIWWATATVTTVGYGDHVPRHGLGRIFGLFWMLAGVFILANFTANVTTELTVQRLATTISGPQDLVGKRLITVKESTADEWLTDHGLSHRVVSTIDEAYEQLAAGSVQAIVYDYPVLLYYALTDGEGRTEVSGEPFHQEDYGIAFPHDSPLREEVNRSLLHLFETGVYNEIANKWFGVVDSQ